MNKNDIFIEKAKKIHGNIYDYSLVNYINNHTKIKIICEHGIFEQTPKKHLFGQGCKKCNEVVPLKNTERRQFTCYNTYCKR